MYCTWQYHKTEFSSVQSLTVRHCNANNIGYCQNISEILSLQRIIALHIELQLHWLHTWYFNIGWTWHNSTLLHNNALAQGLQTTTRGPNPAREAISSCPHSHFVNNEKVIGLHLRKICWFGRILIYLFVTRHEVHSMKVKLTINHNSHAFTF